MSIKDAEYGEASKEIGSGSDVDQTGEYEDFAAFSANHRPGFWTRMGLTPESFKRRTLADKSNQLNQTLKPRHLHMIAIGGSIGAGFFVGSGGALSRGGSGALLICFGIMGAMMFNVVYALGELAIMYPVSGGFYTYSTRFIDPSWGFAMGWNYVLQWAIVLPLELTVAGFTVEYWNPGVSVSVWVTVFLFAIVFVNIFGALGYAEEEFWSSVLKLATIVIFIIIAIVLICGGGKAGSGYVDVLRPIFDDVTGEQIGSEPLLPNVPYSSYVGGTIFGFEPFPNGFKGVCSVFVTAAFAFSGTELVGLAAAEAQNPRKALPGAVKQVFWRITLFYIVGLLMIGLLVRHDDPLLMGNGSFYDTATSPFVIAARRALLTGFDSFVNVVILVSVLSIGNSCVYGGSRTLCALAEQGYAPKIFAYVDRAGRPLFATIAVLLFGFIAYVNEAADGGVVFDWLLAISGLAALFTWGSICLSHVRFRYAWKYQGKNMNEVPFTAAFGVWGSVFSLVLIFLVLVAQFYVALYPVGGEDLSAEFFFKQYLAAPVVIVFYIGGYIWKRKAWIHTSQIDLDTGRRQINWDDIAAEEKHRDTAPMYKRIFYWFC